MLYARVTAWLCVPNIERRVALVAFLCALPSLGIGLWCDDHVLAAEVRQGGPFAAYQFIPRGPAAHAWLLAARRTGLAPWWVGEQVRASFFRPLSSFSLWLDFAHGAAPWWMHLENCAIYALTVWLAIALYKQLGLSDAGLGWAAAFLGLDGAFASSVGWIASRNTLLGTCFGFACLLLHDRARREGRSLLLAPACLCFALSLLSAELGLCTLGYLCAHALTVDRGPPNRRALALTPYAAVAGVHLAYYVTAGFGPRHFGYYQDIFSSPASVLLGFVESIPIWLATTTTAPVAGLQIFLPDAHVPLLVGSIVVLALFVPLLSSRWTQQPQGPMFAIGALLSLLPLASVLPTERVRFFLAFGIYGLLGPWVVRDFDAPERFRRRMARALWRMHGVWLPIFFVPFMFSAKLIGSPAKALDETLPRASSPIAIILNPPHHYVTQWQAAMRSYQGEPSPPVFALYAGGQPVDIRRIDDRSLELHIARSWFTTPFARFRDLSQEGFRAGDRIALSHLSVEVREVDASGAPTRARFTFARSLDDPGLTFRSWQGTRFATWTPPPAGSSVRLAVAAPI